ncbi:hypothetical protein ACLOJK_040806 [Asimina triloba]
MGDDRSGMKMNSLMTSEEDLPHVTTVINVGLRPRRIWNVLVVSVVMSGLDWGDDGPVVMGSDGEKAVPLSSSSPSTVRRCMAGGDGRGGCSPPADAGGGVDARAVAGESSGGGTLPAESVNPEDD